MNSVTKGGSWGRQTVFHAEQYSQRQLFCNEIRRVPVRKVNTALQGSRWGTTWPHQGARYTMQGQASKTATHHGGRPLLA